MARRKFHLTDAQARALEAAYARTKDGLTRTRYQAIRLYGTGYTVREVQHITGCSRTSLMEWCDTYRCCGIEGLHDKRSGGNHRKLTVEQIADLRERLRQPAARSVGGAATVVQEEIRWTVEDLREAIKQWYGVTYSSLSSYHRLFQICGFTYDRAARVFVARR